MTSWEVLYSRKNPRTSLTFSIARVRESELREELRAASGVQPDMMTGRNKADLNVTPLIDVLLVLLIIFMVSTPKRSKGLPANVPKPAEKGVPVNEMAIVVQVSKTGSVLLNTHTVELSALGRRLQELFARRANKVLFVSGNKDAEFHHVARVIDIARGVGIDQVALFK